ncbi:MAG: glycosyltransferase family 4 protein [Gammaproteobacteria bacterium]|nr:glycosyltransferase family 4 protein [Gammaproteobacteria bacterium]
MRLAFVLYKYFPYGGLQRDMRRIAAVCRERGHEVVVYTLGWEGERPEGVEVQVVPVRRASSHARNHEFTRRLRAALAASPVDLVIGFNKMPGLDIYYAADGCTREKMLAERGWMARFVPRYRHFLDYEAAVFGVTSTTEILMISALQQQVYVKHYATPAARMHMLPPGIARDRMAGDDAAQLRASLRAEMDLADDERLVLCIGSGFRTKGLDRSLRALASLPASLAERTRLLAIGDDKPDAFLALARELGVADRFTIQPGRDDIPHLLQGGDLLLHPAYYENTGTVLLEAIVAGLPVLTTAACGYAFHVDAADAGIVIANPFEQDALDRSLADMLDSPRRVSWRQNGISYGHTQDLYRMPELAADLIETLGHRR